MILTERPSGNIAVSLIDAGLYFRESLSIRFELIKEWVAPVSKRKSTAAPYPGILPVYIGKEPLLLILQTYPLDTSSCHC